MGAACSSVVDGQCPKTNAISYGIERHIQRAIGSRCQARPAVAGLRKILGGCHAINRDRGREAVDQEYALRSAGGSDGLIGKLKSQTGVGYRCRYSGSDELYHLRAGVV